MADSRWASGRDGGCSADDYNGSGMKGRDEKRFRGSGPFELDSSCVLAEFFRNEFWERMVPMSASIAFGTLPRGCVHAMGRLNTSRASKLDAEKREMKWL